MGGKCASFLAAVVLHAAKTKRNLQLPFANSNLIDASQTRTWRRHLPGQLLSDLPQREKAHVHPSVPRCIGIDINHSTPLTAHPHSVPDPDPVDPAVAPSCAAAGPELGIQSDSTVRSTALTAPSGSKSVLMLMYH